jgi:hypothetical protein
VTYGKKQQTTFEDRCKSILESNKQALTEMVTGIKGQMESLRRDIVADDERFEDAVKEAKVQEMIKSNKHREQLIMFSKQRSQMKALEEQYRLKRLRHAHFDQLLFMVFRYWSAKVLDILFTSKRNFNLTFSHGRDRELTYAGEAASQPATYGGAQLPQFEVAICFSPAGTLDSEPTMEEHVASFQKAFEDMEQAIFKNHALHNFVHDLNGLFFAKASPYTRCIFDNMQAVMGMNVAYRRQHGQIFEALR